MGVHFDVSAHVTTAQKARLLRMISKISTEGDRLSAYVATAPTPHTQLQRHARSLRRQVLKMTLMQAVPMG
jgi:hypothetical protein